VFKAAGFLSDDPNVGQPTEPLTVYRGASPFASRGVSWTTDLYVALRFAQRALDHDYRFHKEHGVPPHIHRAVVQPKHVLAMFNNLVERESEVVVNPYGRWQLEIMNDVSESLSSWVMKKVRVRVVGAPMDKLRAQLEQMTPDALNKLQAQLGVR
jgi:hypothetical protein